MKYRKAIAIMLSLGLIVATNACSNGNNLGSGNGSNNGNGTPTPATTEVEPASGGEVAVNEEGNYITVEYQYFSENKDGLDFEIPKSITRDGKRYEFTGEAEYQISEIMDVIEQTLDIEVEEKEDLEDEITYYSDKTGKEYKLKKGDAVYFSEPCEIKKTVTKKVNYGPRMEAPEIAKSQTLTYYSKVTETDEELEAPLIDSGSSEPYWLAPDEPIYGTFTTDRLGLESWLIGWTEDYDNDGFADEYRIPLSLEKSTPSWEGYEDEVLRFLELDKEKYKVTSAKWESEIYHMVVNQDEFRHDGWDREIDVAVRDASWTYEALVKDYWATYQGEGITMGYKTRVTYFTTLEELLKILGEKASKEDFEDDLTILYKVKAAAVYKEVI